MNTAQPAQAPEGVPPPAPTATAGLAVASVVLGVLGLITSVIFVGAFLALVGLVLGGIQLCFRRSSRRMAWAGTLTSALAILVTLGWGAFVLIGIQNSMQGMMGGGPRESDYTGWIGKTAPELEVTAVDGSPFKLSELRGRRVIIDVWTTWCGPCRQEIPHFIELRSTLSTNDLIIVGISPEDRLVLKRFISKNPINYPVASVDLTELPPPFAEVSGFPTTFVVDREGRFEKIELGYRELDDLRRFATGEKEAAVPAPVPPR